MDEYQVKTQGTGELEITIPLIDYLSRRLIISVVHSKMQGTVGLDLLNTMLEVDLGIHAKCVRQVHQRNCRSIHIQEAVPRWFYKMLP